MRVRIGVFAVACLGCATARPGVRDDPSSAASAAVAPFRVIDVMPRFWAFWEAANPPGAAPIDSAARQALFRAMVLRPESLLYAGAGGSGEANVAAFLARVGTDVTAMRVLTARLASELPRYGQAFADSFPDFAERGAVYIYPSIYNRNGGVFEVSNQRVLGFGVDMIARLGGTTANLRVLVSHELFHLYHYQRRPEFAGRLALWGQLWREGLATYVSERLTPRATEAEVLSDSTLSRAVLDVLPTLIGDVRAHFDDTSRVATQPYMQSRRVRADIPPRAGYYVGYRIARRLGEGQPLASLARWGGDSLRAKVLAALDEMARQR